MSDEPKYDARARMAGLDFIASAALFLFGGGMAYISWTMKIFNRSRVVSPGLFPFILGVLFMLLALLLGGLALRRDGWGAAKFLLGMKHLRACVTSPRFYRGAVVLLAVLVYVLLFGRLHFVAVTALYLTFNFWYLKALRLPLAVAISVVAAFAIYAVFSNVFGIPIPNGE